MKQTVNDITTLNPVLVNSIISPDSQDELIKLISDEFINKKRPISLAGGRFSMGGQTAVQDTLNIDITKLNKILNYSSSNKTILVESGCLWRNIQEQIDKDNLSIKIMQTYSNFTVGGSLGVNVHGRYVGLGPIILSVNKIKVLLMNGSIVWASPTENQDLFFGTIGCFGALGIILEVELSLTENTNVKQVAKQMKLEDYLEYFKNNIRNNNEVVFNNADIYPNEYDLINVVSWVSTDEELTQKTRLIPVGEKYPLRQYLISVLSERKYGKWIRKNLYDPYFYKKKRIYTRNYEASYDAGELEPKSRYNSTFVLNEYFIPYEKLSEFVPKMADIYKRFNVNVLNISIRHSKPDLGSYLAWAKEEMFCFVVYYKEYKTDYDKLSVPVWTREIMSLVNEFNGSFYLPYQPHATYNLFSKAYPLKDKLFDLKQKYDPNYQLKNSLWEKYYLEYLNPSEEKIIDRSNEFQLLNDPIWYDKTYLFLQNVFTVKNHNYFFKEIMDAFNPNKMITDTHSFIYNLIKINLEDFLSDKFRALKSLSVQKNIIKEQTNSFNLNNIENYLEIGSTGRYVNGVIDAVNKDSNNTIKFITVMNETPPSSSLIDKIDRGQLLSKHNYLKLDYEPLICDKKFDLISCYIGLHHCSKSKLESFIKSISDSINVNGYFILREHDCDTPNMKTFASLIHTIFNIGMDETCQNNSIEERNFESLSFWIDLLNKYDLEKVGDTIYQLNDPSKNGLMLFRKIK